MSNDAPMKGSSPAGLILTPGASARRDHPGLLAIDDVVTATGIVVERIEFPSQAAGKRRPDPAPVCIQVIRTASAELAARLGVGPQRLALGGRSMGGRMCSMAVAEGLEAAALVLISYPLHPPGRPDRLRTAHFPELHLPCLFRIGEAGRLCHSGGARKGDRQPSRDRCHSSSSTGTIPCASGNRRSPISSDLGSAACGNRG